MASSNRRDKLALMTTCIKNVKFMIIKIKTCCQYMRYFYYSKNPNWAAQNLRLGHMQQLPGSREFGPGSNSLSTLVYRVTSIAVIL